MNETAPGLLVIANPVAGGGRGRDAGRSVVDALRADGATAELRYTEHRGHARLLAAEARGSAYRAVVVCGGDGTVHEVVEVLAGTHLSLGLVPCGRGNDLARALDIPRDLREAVRVLLAGQVRRIDLGRVGQRYFATVACLGFDAEVGRLVHENRVPFSGTAAYLWAVLRTLRGFRYPRVRLEGDFGVIEERVLLVAVGNTCCYGGGMRITPDALCDDGRLDVCLVRELPRLRALRYFPRLFRGRHAGLPEVRMERTRSLRLSADEPSGILADGEPLASTPVTIDVAPEALGVLAPA